MSRFGKNYVAHDGGGDRHVGTSADVEARKRADRAMAAAAAKERDKRLKQRKLDIAQAQAELVKAEVSGDKKRIKKAKKALRDAKG